MTIIGTQTLSRRFDTMEELVHWFAKVHEEYMMYVMTNTGTFSKKETWRKGVVDYEGIIEITRK